MTNPFLKWAGRKDRVLPHLLPLLPQPTGKYIEPFLGSASVFLALQPKTAVLSDVNTDLMLVYRCLQKDPEGLISRCQRLWENGNDKTVYLSRRERFNNGALGEERASLFIYLNRHGFNGLCRYNLSGKYNVPFGKYKRPFFPVSELRGVAKAMKGCDLHVSSFSNIIAKAEEGDTVYCDPPYVPLTPTSSFTSYWGRFGDEEQEELARCALAAARRGATVVISNHDTEQTRSLYSGASQIISFDVRRSISAKNIGRKPVRELLAQFTPC